MRACFLGLGYIGLPTAIIAASHGIEVAGTDINTRIVDETNAGRLHIVEPDLNQLLVDVVRSGMLHAYNAPVLSDAYFIVVPTPFLPDTHKPDISFVENATRSVIPLLKEGDLFVIESTSPVGTTESMAEIVFTERPELKGKIYIAYCPERVLPGNILHELINNDRVIGGIDAASTEKAKEFYSVFVKGQLHSTDCRTAEMCKLTENASRDAQIAFANELSIVCAKAGIDVRELISLANKHPRVNILQPGCGVGGHCIAVDPYFIISSYPEETAFMRQARETNIHKTEWCINQILSAYYDIAAESGKKPTVALMGLAFKPNIDDLRESPAVTIAKTLLSKLGQDSVLVSEPNLSSHDTFVLTSYKEAYEKSDLVVFLVNHREFASLVSTRSDVRVLDFCGVTKA